MRKNVRAVIALAAMCLATAAHATPPCGAHDDITASLAREFGEAVQLQALTGAGAVVTPANVYEAGALLTKGLGEKNGDKYFTRPPEQPSVLAIILTDSPARYRSHMLAARASMSWRRRVMSTTSPLQGDGS